MIEPWLADFASGALGEVVYKHDFRPIYEAADRHGVEEWLYRREATPLVVQFVRFAGWNSGLAEFTFEAAAAVSTGAGYTLQVVQRTVLDSDSAQSWDQYNSLASAAVERADRLLEQATIAQETGESVIETPFVVRRQMN